LKEHYLPLPCLEHEGGMETGSDLQSFEYFRVKLFAMQQLSEYSTADIFVNFLPVKVEKRGPAVYTCCVSFCELNGMTNECRYNELRTFSFS